MGPQQLKVRKKLEAGAEFFITAPIFDLEKLRQFRQSLGPQTVKILACLKVPKAEEVEQAAQGRHRKVYSLPPEWSRNWMAMTRKKFYRKAPLWPVACSERSERQNSRTAST